MKAEELKQQFLQSYTPGNYTDEEFGEMASEFEKDLDELLDEVSREVAVNFELRYSPGSSKGAKKLAYQYFNEWQSKQELP